MTLLESARKNKTTTLIRKVAARESVNPGWLLSALKAGKVVIPNNRLRNISKPCAIGEGLSTKINANLGTSTDRPRINEELTKLRAAIKYGADAVMDLSIAGDMAKIRRLLIRHSSVPLGTVPIYEVAVNAQHKRGNFLHFDIDDILEVLEVQAKDGVDFFTIHAGVTRKSVSALKTEKRAMGIVSRGGAILASWMQSHKKENPFFEHFNKVLDIARSYDVTISLGDGLRPGSILDSTDSAQISELKTLGSLTGICRKNNVQVMIEGPGHVPLDEVRKNVLLEKKYCHRAPFYVLGPLVTDVAAGYDHISAAIGGALAASYGADFLCYVTPAEHLRHPELEDVREGVIASRIAAHAADIVKMRRQAISWDRQMSYARKRRDWRKQIELSIDPEKADNYRKSSKPVLSDVCTMCGRYCSIKIMEQGCDKTNLRA